MGPTCATSRSRPAAILEHRDIAPASWKCEQPFERFTAQVHQAIEENDRRPTWTHQQVMKRTRVRGRQALEQGVQHAFVFHLQDDLDDQPVAGGLVKKLGECGVIERVAVIVGMDADSGHLVRFVAAPYIFFPVRQQRVDDTEGAQYPLARRATRRRQAIVYRGEIAVQEPIQAARPCLGDSQAAEPAHQGLGLVVGEPARNDQRESQTLTSIMASLPWNPEDRHQQPAQVSPRISRRSASAMSAPSTLATCDAKLRPGTSLP